MSNKKLERALSKVAMIDEERDTMKTKEHEMNLDQHDKTIMMQFGKYAKLQKNTSGYVTDLEQPTTRDAEFRRSAGKGRLGARSATWNPRWNDQRQRWRESCCGTPDCAS